MEGASVPLGISTCNRPKRLVDQLLHLFRPQSGLLGKHLCLADSLHQRDRHDVARDLEERRAGGIITTVDNLAAHGVLDQRPHDVLSDLRRGAGQREDQLAGRCNGLAAEDGRGEERCLLGGQLRGDASDGVRMHSRAVNEDLLAQ